MLNEKIKEEFKKRFGNYNENMFTVISAADLDPNYADDPILHFNDQYDGPIDLPDNVFDTTLMFADCTLKENCYLRNFDTSNVFHMSSMFVGCHFSKNFTLGDKFDTSNVTHMDLMFAYCEMPDNFSLGDKFDTSHVYNMDSMFAGCHFPENFTLGDKFDTSKVAFMDSMFKDCYFPENFTLGDKFDTSNVEHMAYIQNGMETEFADPKYIFTDCNIIPKGFDFPPDYLKHESSAKDKLFAQRDKMDREQNDVQDMSKGDITE